MVIHMELVHSTQCAKDLRKMQKQGKDVEALRTLIKKLAAGKKLEPKHRDHPLKGDHVGYRECHITPDWLLIYKVIDKKILRLARTGSHSELF
jgi:mRNA interferase YafQ